MTREEFIARAAAAIGASSSYLSSQSRTRLAAAALDAVGAWKTFVDATSLLRTRGCADPDCCARAIAHEDARNQLAATMARAEATIALSIAEKK